MFVPQAHTEQSLCPFLSTSKYAHTHREEIGIEPALLQAESRDAACSTVRRSTAYSATMCTNFECSL